MDWSGGITAGLAINYSNPNEPFPEEVGIGASLGGSPYPRFAQVWGGEATYPAPELFDSLSEFELLGNTTWSDILDGQGTIRIQYKELILLDGRIVDHGFVILNAATLVVEGAIVPEPATIVLFAAGIIGPRTRKRKK
jgi:hypothetical protein